MWFKFVAAKAAATFAAIPRILNVEVVPRRSAAWRYAVREYYLSLSSTMAKTPPTGTMSALPPKAAATLADRRVRFGPIADIQTAARRSKITSQNSILRRDILPYIVAA